MSKEMSTTNQNSQLPAHLQNLAKPSMGNVDSSDLIIPRIKLLQPVSPEVTDFADAKPGNFWHALSGSDLGTTLRIVPIIVRKTVVLWAPRDDGRGILASSRDCVHWDSGADSEFEVKLNKGKTKVTWRTKGSVAESRLAEFGSSIPEDSQSQPAASTTYTFLVHLLDAENEPLGTIINARSSFKMGKQLVSKCGFLAAPHFAQIYKVTTRLFKNGSENYYNYVYTNDGYTDEDLYKVTSAQFRRFSEETNWKAQDEAEEDLDAAASARSTEKVDTKDVEY